MGFSGETLFKEISFSVDEKDKINTFFRLSICRNKLGRPFCRISRVICLPPVCSTRAACKTGARWLAALKTLCAICGWPLAIRLPARPAAIPACAGTLSRPKACLKQAGWPP